MYNNSRITPYTNRSARPFRVDHSRWSLDTPTTINLPSHEPTAVEISSSVYFPYSQQSKQVHTPDYINCYQPLSQYLSNYDRPKSTIICDSISQSPSSFHVNDLRQRYETKAVVGIVKPMVHQRSYTQLNSDNNNNENKASDMTLNNFQHHNSSRSLHPPASISSSTSSVMYRIRPTVSNNNINSQPPIAPRRLSSISTDKRGSSHRSSRTTSTSSSIIGINELSSRISSHENEQQQQQNDENTIIVDVKRLEMFYGSVGTLVKSARSIAHLYITTTRQLANFEDWSCQQVGVPIWIYNTGANLKRTRQVRLMLAQPESCFAVWSSLISDKAELRLPKENYITCWLPESNMLAVFKFDRNDACRLFFRHYYEILEYERRMNLANPPPLPADSSTPQQQQQQQKQHNNNNNNNKEVPRRYSRLRTISSKQDKEQEQQQYELRRCRSLSKIRTVKKSDISGPINFEHINHVSNGSNQQKQRPLSGSITLRSLHASMSHLPNSGTITERIFNQNKKRASAYFEPRTTAV
ncbi:unnamed protein product [Adineta steineri]|uniref:CRIB domain-containing protein n=1 Tax=Adineta steineri TaxID=433720 RepID=A0A814BCM0_9BILA|nr:unnamed protein product [Adineta steineri]CAF3531518.1 unnamed protein product [Adineta steineri]